MLLMVMGERPKRAHQRNVRWIGTILYALSVLRYCQLPLPGINQGRVPKRLIAFQLPLQGRPDPDDDLQMQC